MRITGYLLLVWALVVGCENRYPLKVDFETANATIIGREICSRDTSLNAWLIDLGPTFSSKTMGTYYGREATVNGKLYARVVKTYSSLVSSLDTTKPYVFNFYVEDVVAKPNCNLPASTSINVPQIRVASAPVRVP